MGCNSSKSQDIQKDRQRRHDVAGMHPDQVFKSPNRPITQNMIDPNDTTGVYGASFTDKRLEEYDFLRNIIEKTQQDFIDVGHKPDHLDEKDIAERGAHYSTKLMQTKISEESTVFDLPASTHVDARDISNVLETAVMSKEQQQISEQNARQCAQSLSSMVIKGGDNLVVQW